MTDTGPLAGVLIQAVGGLMSVTGESGGPPREVFPAADGEIVVAVGNDGQFAALGEVLGLPPDPRFARNADRVAHRDELAAEISARLRTGPVNHWIPLLTARGVPCGPVNDLAAAFGLAADLGLEPIVPPITLLRTPVRYDRRPPKLAEHTLEDR
ncbi:CoA transferase [Actinoplanes sp. NPDC024001]|uniref:CoA transferase n=1 Tax=Actinoplanes sp. NPDC024001 TaxID=3154598 RepID=UPI0033D0A119